MIYHFDEMCQSVLEKGEKIPLEELQLRIKKKYGIKLRAETFARYVRKIEVEHGIAPLNTYYEINAEYLDRVGRNRQGTSWAWKRYMQGENKVDNDPVTI